MNELGLTDLYEAAARATINERCAPAYLHDVRGSLQALLGALELLGRSARAGGGDPSTASGRRLRCRSVHTPVTTTLTPRPI